jgi:hypothetical protein
MSTANPYRPGVGLQPAYLAGRGLSLTAFKRLLDGAPEIPANARVTGLRGVGKTVLLQRFQAEAEMRNWSTIFTEIEPRHTDDEAFFLLIQNLTNEHHKRVSPSARAKEAVADFVGAARQTLRVTYQGFEWSLAGDLDAGTRSTAEMLLSATKDAIDSHRVGLVVLLDEAQILTDERETPGSHALSSLIAAVSLLQKQNVPVSLVLCGLPTLTVNLLRARTYSERMFRGFKVDSLGRREAQDAFTRPLEGTGISAAPDLVDKVVTDVGGYPYFIQLWGAELWDAAAEDGRSQITTAVLQETEARIRSRLDLDFYEPRVDSLRPSEQDLLLASASCSYPPLVVAELNSKSPKSNENINVLLGRLVNANVLYRERKGKYFYTAPGFREYLVRRASEPEDAATLF